MFSTRKKRAYSIAEALVTLFIVALVFIIIAPNIVTKKPKFKNFFQANHGVKTCTGAGSCTIDIPKDIKDIFVIAVGGGGGGAGSNCSSESSRRSGKQDEVVKGNYKFAPGRALYVFATSASGGSYAGQCRRYPGDFFPDQHTYRCNNYPNASYTNTSYVCLPKEVFDCDKVWSEEKKEYVEKCVSYVPKKYRYDHTAWDRYSGRISCNFNHSVSKECSSYSNGSGTFPMCSPTYTFYHSFSRGVSQEDQLKGAGTCSTTWLLKPQGADQHRGCDRAVFGGKGGSGYVFNQRICPEPLPETCLVKRSAHNVSTGCTDEDIANGLRWRGEGYSGKQCGHPYGAYNCTTPHKGPVGEKCMQYSEEGTNLVYTIGIPGKKGGGDGGPLSITRVTNLSGGYGGKKNRHGNGGGGIPGGGHSPGDEYTTDPTDNSRDGQPGYITFTEKYINVGMGGGAGEMKAGYFKNVKGPITITVGAGGAGGNGGAGGTGGTTIVKAAKGGFSSTSEAEPGILPQTGGFDLGSATGLLFSAKGGPGGAHSKHYEQCDGDNTYGGGAGAAAKIYNYGKGGDGAGGTVPDCNPSKGSSGLPGGAIIFY